MISRSDLKLVHVGKSVNRPAGLLVLCYLKGS